MKILVIEDKAIHQQSARDTLKGHDVTILGSLDEAMETLVEKYGETKLEELLQEADFPAEPDCFDQKRHCAWEALRRQLGQQAVIPLPYEVVLTDMMMPMSERCLACDAYEHGELVSYGLIIALRAAACGAKFVAMVTDTNHHLGAMSAALDHLGTAYYENGFKSNFVINGAKCMFVHTPFAHRPKEGNPVCKGYAGQGPDGKCEGADCDICQGTGIEHELTDLKNWGQILKDLMS